MSLQARLVSLSIVNVLHHLWIFVVRISYMHRAHDKVLIIINSLWVTFALAIVIGVVAYK